MIKLGPSEQLQWGIITLYLSFLIIIDIFRLKNRKKNITEISRVSGMAFIGISKEYDQFEMLNRIIIAFQGFKLFTL